MDEPSDSQPEILGNTVPLPGWTKEDKFFLLTAVREFGSSKITNIANYVGKSEKEIQEALELYKERANLYQKTKKTTSQTQPQIRNIPLDNWIKMLMTNSKIEELQSETTNAVRLIAELEDIPKPLFVENTNFRHIYLTIADALEGKPLTSNVQTKHLLQKLIIETALHSKSFAKRINVKGILKDAVNAKENSIFFRQSDDIETSVISKLITLDNYNPLKIPADALDTASKSHAK